MLFRTGFVGRQVVGGSGASGPPGATLALNFMQPGVLDPRITFTRASTGTYFDSTGTMQTAGLNLAIPSTNWYANATVSTTTNGTTQNAGIAPNGTNTAMLAVPSGTSGAHQWYQIFAGAVSTTYTQSIYAKAAGYNYLFLNLGNTGFGANATFATFDLINGVVSLPVGPGVNPTIQAVGNGWYRCSISGTTLASAGTYVGDIRVSSTNNGNAGFAGDMVSGLLLWGSQIEFGPVATQYAPTTTVANSAPRWDYDPVTLQLRGLLIEEARTNLWLQSADASNAAWSKSGSPLPVVTANQITAPDGSLTAARVVYGNVIPASGFCLLAQTLTGTVAAYTCSVWLRGTVGGEILWIMATVDGVNYYRTQCTLTTGWQRFTLTTPNLTAASWFIQIGVDRRDTGQTPAPPTQTVYVWGGQLELGAFPTSYIPTTAAAVTRAADLCSMPTNVSWFSAASSSLAVECITLSDVTVNSRELCVLSDGTTSNRMGLRVNGNTNNGIVYSSVSGTAVLSTSLGSLVANSVSKIAAMWNGTAPRGVLNGGAPVGYTQGLPTGITVMTIGAQLPNGVFPVNSYVRRVTYWPRALTDAEMQQVTT